MVAFTMKIIQKKNLEICQKIETMLALDRQLTVHIYTCVTCLTYFKGKHILKLKLTLTLFLNFQFGQKKGLDFLHNYVVYMLGYNTLWIILEYLFSTGQMLQQQSMDTQLTAPALDMYKLPPFWKVRIS
jgi:hypothetical protein